MVLLFLCLSGLSVYVCYRCYETMQVVLFLLGFYSSIFWIVIAAKWITG